MFQDLFRVFVYEPQLNILYWLYKYTNDMGVSIVLLAFIVNLLIYPLFVRNFINLQKTRILQPRIREIQKKYKDNPQVMFSKMREFNRKHGLNGGYTFLVLLIQIFFISGLYWLIRDVVDGKELEGLYQIFSGEGVTSVTYAAGDNLKAFGLVPIGASASDYLVIPVLTAFLSFLYGSYTFKWAPKPKLLEVVKSKKPKKKDTGAAFDPEAMQKSLEFQSIYVMPFLLFVIQYTLPSGLNIYFMTSTLFALLRQVILSTFYSSHVDNLMKDIIESDPSSRDDDPSNNLEITGDPAELSSNLPVAQVVEGKIVKGSKKSTQKKSSKKSKTTKGKKSKKK